MDDAKQQLVDKLQTANNILVTVSRDPSLDQLSSCIALTLLLNKQGKHAAAVFSGKVPTTLEFLKPDETLEKNTDSLRDFIISLDKSKADKLRYKVEEDVVRIFITPYKTSLSEDDLEFSEGDFNVDVVVALGVKEQKDLDQAITAHGRILHDATVTSLNTTPDSGLGTINWHDPQASSLSEMVTDLAQILDESGEMMDQQIATALLTGIVSETSRFSNDRTSAQTMSASAALLSAGANQQLVASKLESGQAQAKAAVPDDAPSEKGDSADGNGILDIDHSSDPVPAPEPMDEPAEEPPAPQIPPPAPTPAPAPAPPPPPAELPPQEPPASGMTHGPRMITEPPKLGGTLTANSEAEHLDPVTDPMSLPQDEGPAMFTPPPKSQPSPAPPAPKFQPAPPPPAPAPAPEPPAPPAPPSFKPEPPRPDPKSTLADIEKSVDSPHIAKSGSVLDSARGAVDQALAGSEEQKPIEALNAQPMGGELHGQGAGTSGPAVLSEARAPVPPASDSPAAPAEDNTSDDDDKPGGSDTPPPVPPPIPFQFGNSPPPQP